MKQFLKFVCTGPCKKVTVHDVLSKTEEGINTKLRISCRHCNTPPFEINYPREIIAANLQTALNGTTDNFNNLEIPPNSEN